MSERMEITRLDEARIDHLTRYMFAGATLSPRRVLDLGCGVGYGSYLMGMAGCDVRAIDLNPGAIISARKHFARKNVEFETGDITKMELEADAATCFECIEHIEDPLPFLRNLEVSILLASVPNQEVIPWTKNEKFHYRHYTPLEFTSLLSGAGFRVIETFGQNEKTGLLERPGRSIFVMAHK